MRSACLVRTCFILNNFQWDWIGGPRTPRTPLGHAPGTYMVWPRFTAKTATVKRATEKTATEDWATGKLSNSEILATKNKRVGKKGNKQLM